MKEDTSQSQSQNPSASESRDSSVSDPQGQPASAAPARSTSGAPGQSPAAAPGDPASASPDRSASAAPNESASESREEAGASPPPVPDLRAARIMEASDHSNADRLLVMKIDLGEEERQIVAGIAEHYEPEDLVGKGIVVVANLRPAKLRGEVSQAMLLAAEDEEGRLGLLLAPEAPPGLRIRTPSDPEPAPEITFEEFHQNEMVAHPDAVTLNGEILGGAPLLMDRDVYGKLR
ncbi:MAG: hypothetical protein R6W82_06170 [bacterium]